MWVSYQGVVPGISKEGISGVNTMGNYRNGELPGTPIDTIQKDYQPTLMLESKNVTHWSLSGHWSANRCLFYKMICFSKADLSLILVSELSFWTLKKKCGPHTERHLFQSRLLEHELDCSSTDNGFVLMNCVHDGHNYEVLLWSGRYRVECWEAWRAWLLLSINSTPD